MPMNKRSGYRVLVADDDEIVRDVLDQVLSEAGLDVTLARDGHEAVRQIPRGFEVVILDLRMPGRTGLECLQFLKQKSPEAEAIMVTASSSVSDAIAAMKSGAFDYLTKPVNPDEVLEVVKRALETIKLKGENRQLRRAIGLPSFQPSFIGESPPVKRLLSRVGKVADLNSTVLITGESGVGKGLVARLIHSEGNRRSQNFVTVSCTALPRELVEAELFGHEKGAFTGAHETRPGRIEMADRGTLFLDEVGDMPIDLQPKLLNFLQDRFFQRLGGNPSISVNVRVIAATHQDLKALCEEKRFREDLLFRLNVLPIHIAPLRERKQDIPSLVDFFLSRIASQRSQERFELDDEVHRVLAEYRWPGNVRELENVLERATAFAEDSRVHLIDLPPEVRQDQNRSSLPASGLAGVALSEIERQAIIQTLELCEGNKSRAARSLGISEKSIYNKMKRLGLR